MYLSKFCSCYSSLARGSSLFKHIFSHLIFKMIKTKSFKQNGFPKACRINENNWFKVKYSQNLDRFWIVRTYTINIFDFILSPFKDKRILIRDYLINLRKCPRESIQLRHFCFKKKCRKECGLNALRKFTLKMKPAGWKSLILRLIRFCLCHLERKVF